MARSVGGPDHHAGKAGKELDWFDPAGCKIDFLQLEAMARECAAAGGRLPLDRVAGAETLMRSCGGHVLPDWEQWEVDAIGYNAAGGDRVPQLRARADIARATVLQGLGAHYLSIGEPHRAT